MSIPFTKMQGLGNDFVVIDATEQPFTLSKNQIKQMADRRFGIGFDQMLVLEPPTESAVDFNFRIFNADGTEVGQCGNGARCLARYIYRFKFPQKKKFTLKTIEKQMQLVLTDDGEVQVDMGHPKFAPHEIPYQSNQLSDHYQITIDDTPIEFGLVNVGNPHAVIQVVDVEAIDVLGIGSQLSTHSQFPLGTNVGFMQVINPLEIKLRVYERGAAETLACGSGACAAVVVGRAHRLLDDTVSVSQKGGNLMISWGGCVQDTIKMKGPAEFVYQGQWPLENIRP